MLRNALACSQPAVQDQSSHFVTLPHLSSTQTKIFEYIQSQQGAADQTPLLKKKDIAQALSIPENTVRSLITRLRKQSVLLRVSYRCGRGVGGSVYRIMPQTSVEITNAEPSLPSPQSVPIKEVQACELQVALEEIEKEVANQLARTRRGCRVEQFNLHRV